MWVGVAMTLQINITPNGRMSLPADVRKRLDLTGGGAIYSTRQQTGSFCELRTKRRREPRR